MTLIRYRWGVRADTTTSKAERERKEQLLAAVYWSMPKQAQDCLPTPKD
jgi:hypothetical protein